MKPGDIFRVVENMREQQNMVRDFHEKAGALISERPAIPDAQNARLRINLIREELQELHTAMGTPNTDSKLLSEPNLNEIADGIGDLLYVVLGTAVACGLDAESIFEEIHRSNMTKFIDGNRREDGKWIKGPSYTPPDLSSYIL